MIVQGITPSMPVGRLLDCIEIGHVNRSLTLTVLAIVVVIDGV